MKRLCRFRLGLSAWANLYDAPILAALFVGAGVGLVTVGYRYLLQAVAGWAFGPLRDCFGFLGPFSLAILPVLGGLVSGLITYYFAREAKGQGIPEVMEAVALHGGRIRPAIMVNALASIFTIGLGGSAGRVAPVVQLGAGLGYLVGNLSHRPAETLRTLVACGAAAGIAATFNAPIAGVFFALEVILGQVNVPSFSTIAVSAVMGSVVGRAFFGDAAVFSIPTYALVSSTELIFYVGLGILTALAGVFFVRAMDVASAWFERWTIFDILEPALGGLLIGLLALTFPQVLGMGSAAIEDALYMRMSVPLMLALSLFKILATSWTLGSGGSGGIFAPTLFIGAMLGGAYGGVMHRWLPGITASAGAYALVGMAAVFAATARAPITAVIILFEMTRDYHIILPLMLTTVVSAVIASALEAESIYTRKLVKRGIDLHAFREFNLMRAITVAEAMSPLDDDLTIEHTASLDEAVTQFSVKRRQGLVVLDAQGALFGVVTLSDLNRARQQTGEKLFPMAQVCTRDVQVVFPDEVLEDALDHFAAFDVGQFPVVRREAQREVVGVLVRDDIIRAYARVARDLAARRHHMTQVRLQRETGSRLVTFVLQRGDRAVGRRVMDLQLPMDCLLVSIKRGRETIIPSGATRLLQGDHVVIIAVPAQDAQIRDRLREGTPAPAAPNSAETAHFVEWTLVPGDAAIEQHVRDLSLPSDSLLVSIKRGERVIIPHGDTLLLAGDRVKVLVAPQDEAQVFYELRGTVG